jgi:flagellar hook assembly protein FlgD
MKNQFNNIFKSMMAVAIVLTLGTGATFAQGTSANTATALAKGPIVLAPKSLAVAVFQVENTLKFKVHMENYASNDVTIKIKNGANKVIYQEKVKDASKYIRKFDFSTMADGEYTFEVSNNKETYTKDISLQTLSARSLQINE